MNLLVLDGNSIINRAYYGIKLLSTKDGIFTNGIYGFLTILQKIREECKPDAVAVAFDLKGPTFRHEEYKEYKAGRKGMPDELAMQMPILKELLTHLGYKIVSCQGFEADDILGTLSRVCKEKGVTCMIATGDRDSLQLVSDTTTVRLASTKFGQSVVTLYDKEKIMEDYGVEPLQMIDIKAIQGDSSDNIPGVAGIGEKGAGELIRKFGSVEYIYNHLEELDIKPGMRDKLEKSRDNAFLSYRLGTINRFVPIETDPSYYKIGEINMRETSALMVKLELFKLMEKLSVTVESTAENAPDSVEIKLSELESPMTLLPMLEDEGEAFFISSEDFMYFAMDNEVIRITPTDIFLKSFAKNKGIKKYTWDIKQFFKTVKQRAGAHLEAVTLDIMLAAYLLDASATGYGVERLAAQHQISLGNTGDKNADTAAALPQLSKAILEQIAKNNQLDLLNNIELPLALVLGDMELEGFEVDAGSIKEFGNTLSAQLTQLQKSVMEQVGYEFNLNSPKQLGEALFEKMKLPHGKKTKSGYSTSAEVLESLQYEAPVIRDILTYRTLSKLNSTYCEGLLKVIGQDNRIHSSFNQAETRTGRISSTEPNLQNIPVRTDLGRELRRFFIAREGNVLVDADYSQIELRVLAHVANDKVMIDSFNEGKDIHKATAARVFGVPEELVTSKMRSSAKAVNFGIVYGIGAFSLSKDIGVSRFEAENYIKEYLKNFSGVSEYMDRIIADAKENGFVQDIFGRRRYLPELSSSNFNMRSFGERVARNMPIQGAAADIIKIAMIRVYNRLKSEGLKARLILQVHDELIVECPENEAETVKKLLTQEMEGAVSMQVPMMAEANIGKNWYLAKG